MNNIKTIRQFFDYLNLECDYLVLRNWDDIFDENIYGSGHEDIDILCSDLNKFVALTGAVRVHSSIFRDNFKINIGPLTVRFDVRYIGDGYYPKKWEEVMLKRKVLTSNQIFVMNQEDYTYSLSYHALIQKPVLSKEYKAKLIEAHHNLLNNTSALGESDMLKLLIEYCNINHYIVEIPSDPGVYLNYKNLRMFKCRCQYDRLLRRWSFRSCIKIVNCLSYVKSQLS